MATLLSPMRQLTTDQLPVLYRVLGALQSPNPTAELRDLLAKETHPGAVAGFEAALAELTRQGRA